MVRDAFFEAAELLATVLADPRVAAAWDEPSALDRMTVGALAAHVARAVSTPSVYLDGPEPEGAELRSAVAYFAEVLGLAGDDLDAPLHVGVRDRAQEGAAAGSKAVADAVARDLASVRATLVATPADRIVAVFGGIAMTIDDYLATRVVELVVHLDDLAASVPGLDADLPDASAEVAVAVLAELARVRHGTTHVVRHLARRERATGTVAAL